LGDAREAISIWNRVIEGAPDDAEALQTLAGLYERDRRWPALIEVVRRQARAKGLELKLKVVLLEKVGTLFSEKLTNPDKAVEAYQEIVRLMPTHAKAMRTLRELYAAAGRYGELETLYRAQGQYEELCEILTSVAERLADATEKIRLYTRVADIAQHELKSPERAAKAYERILAVDAENQPAAQALVPIYRASEKWARLLAVFEIILGAHSRQPTADSDQTLALHREIVQLCEEKLGSKSLAFAWAARAYQLRPVDVSLQKNLERLAAEAEAWEELAEIYVAEVDKETDDARRIDRYRQLARIALTRLYKPDDARKWFEEVLARAPEDAEALGNLEQIFTQSGNYKELLEIYRKREARAADPQRRLEMLFKIAWIEEEQIGDPLAASATYRKIIDTDKTPATQTRALRALEKLNAARGDAGGMADVLERQMALADKNDVDTRLELSHRLGEIYELNLNQADKALAHYRAAFALSSSHKPTVAALERWLVAGKAEATAEDRVAVARLLLPVYEQRLVSNELDAAAKLVEALGILLGAEKDPAAELALYRRLMDLAATQLGDAARAYDYGGKVFTRAPADAENRRMMAMLADQLEKPDDWAVQLSLMEEAADKRGDKQLARDLAWDLGQLFDTRLGMPNDAEQAYRRVLDRDPSNEDAQIALVQLYSVNERWNDLRTMLEGKKLRAPDNEGRLSLLYQISDLDEGVLDDREAATRDYVEILELDPGSQRAFRALERLYTTDDKWKELDELLSRRIPFAPEGGEAMGTPDSRAHLTFRRGELHANRLDDPRGAADLFEASLGIERRHEGARKGLESLMKRSELRQRIAKALEPLYREDEAWPKLALVLGAQREAAEGHQAAALLSQIGELQEERLGARQLALATWREALRIDPADKRIRQNVERLATLLGRQTELAQAWEEAFLASDPTDLALRGELLESAAELYEHELSDIDKARATWKRLLELDPTNLHTARPAAGALARLYETAEDWRPLIDVLHRQAEWADRPGEKKDLLFRIGRIQEELLVDPPAAIGTYREILDDDAADLRALDALEKLHLAQGQWPELTDVLRRRLELTVPSDADRRDLMWRIAQLNERELDDAGEAIAGYHAILDERPEDMPALDALARLYEGGNRPADLLEILERRQALADQHGETAAATKLRLQVAAILDGFGRREEALERFREVLDAEPRNATARAGVEKYLEDPDLRLRAAEVLEPHYQTSSELDKQIQLAELWAQHAPDPRERIARLTQIAQLKERAGDDDSAFEALARAARIGVGEPELPSLLDGIERLAPAAARPKLVALYRELGVDVLDAAVQERVYLAVAAESHKLGDRETAREYYRRVLDMSPDHPKPLDALESIYVEGREWEPLYEVYVRRAEMSLGDDDRRRHYLMQLAQLCEGNLDRPLEAIRAYEQVLEMFPNDGEAGRALEQRYLAAHRHAELAELLEKRLGFCDDVDEAVALRFRLATIYDEDLADSDRAVENYRAALGGDPTHAGAIRALEKYLDDDGQRVSAAEVLEPTYAARHDWPSLVRIYQIRLEAADDHRTRLVLVKRIARLYEEQLEDLDGAFTWFAKVFREEPSDRATRDQLARLAGILEGWPRLAEVYEAYVADEGPDSPDGVEVLRTLAQIYHGRLEDVDRAKAAYQRLLEIDANDEAAFFNLEKLLSRAARWSDLLAVYRDAADNTIDIERKKVLLYKQAGLLEDQLADADAAIDTWRAALDVDGEDERAIASLDRLYTSGKRWHDLVELTLRRLERVETGGPGWIALKLRLGGIFEAELNDLPAAIDTYEEVLGHVSAHPDAVRSLERLIVDHDHTFRIAQILEPIYREQDAWQKLVVIYDAELEFIDDKARRVELLREIARIHEKRGGDVRLAFGALARAWSEEASETDAEAREAELFLELRRLAHMLGMWRDLVDVLQKAVADSYDYDLQARVYARVADIQERELGDRAAAIESWRKVVGVRDDGIEAYKALERLLADESRNKELVQILEKRASLSNDVHEQKQLAYRAAELYEEALGEPEQAIGTWRHVLTLDDGDRAALDALERLYFAKGSFRDLCGILTQKIEQNPDPAAQRPLRLQLAQLSELELHDALAAIDAYKGILSNDPRDVEALEAVARLYAAEGLYADHLEALDALAEAAGAAGDQTRKVELAFKAAQVLEREVGDQESAIARYRDVLFADAAVGTAPHAGARAALEKLVRDESMRDQAAAVLEPFYEQHSDFHALIDVTELRLQAESEPQEKRRLLSRIAELNEAGIEDLQAAFSAWGRVLAEEPGDEAAQVELERLAELTSAPGELARVYEERMAAAFDPEVQRALALKLGTIYEAKLGDEERAITVYNKALDLPGPDGSDRVPLSALDRLLQRAARWRDLADVLEKEAQAALDSAEQAEFFYRLGALRAGELIDLDGALLAYRDAIQREPEHAPTRAGLEKLLASSSHVEAALEVLEPLYENDQSWEKVVQLAEVRLGITSGQPEQAALLETIAERCENELKDQARALDAMARALRLRPDEPRLADEVERLGEAAGDPRRAADTFEAVLDGGGVVGDGARDLGLRTAQLWDKLGEGDRAEARYLYVLEVDGDNREALEALDRTYRMRGSHAELARILDRRADIEYEVGAKKKLYAEAAELHERALADTVGAIAGWKKVLEVDDGDAQALDALARLHEREGQWQELVAILAQKVRVEDDASAQVGLKSRIAAIWAEKIGDLDRAVDAYRDLLDHAPDSRAALDALEELERRRGDWTAVQEVLVRQLQTVGAGAPQVPVYKKLVALAVDKHGSPDDAIGYLHEILQVAPEEPEANAKLVELLEKTERYNDLIDVLTEQANRRATAKDTAGEIALLVRAADVWEQRLGNAEASTEILERILERDPSNVRALMSLAHIYESAHDSDKARATLERAVELAESPAERAELHYRLGKLTADATSEEAAEEHWLRALDDDGTHAGALGALEKLARGRGDWSRVAELLALRAGELSEAERRPLYVELADVYGTKLKQPEAALPYLEELAKQSPEDPAVVEPLANLYFAAGRYDDALPLYRGLAEKLAKGKKSRDLARLNQRIGAIAEKKGDDKLAMEQYNAAFQIDPQHTPTMVALGRLYMSAGEWEKARRIYRSMLLQNLDPAAGVTKADIYLALGEIHEKLGESPKAAGMFERGLEVDGTHIALKAAIARVKPQ
ncbi:MAG: repeat-containing protein, partial [Myxococcales bacterium]|nr:repeat-containing protein [Myxococcales bacterium]